MLTFAPATGAPVCRSTVPFIDASGSQAKSGKVRTVMATAERKRGRFLMVPTFSNNNAIGVVVGGNYRVPGLAAFYLSESCDAGRALMSEFARGAMSFLSRIQWGRRHLNQARLRPAGNLAGACT